MLHDGETTGRPDLHPLDLRSLIARQLVARTGGPLFGNKRPVPSAFLGASDPRSPEAIHAGRLGEQAGNSLGTEVVRPGAFLKASDHLARYGPCQESR